VGLTAGGGGCGHRLKLRGECNLTEEQFACAVEFNKWVHAAGYIGASPNNAAPDGMEWPPLNKDAVQSKESLADSIPSGPILMDGAEGLHVA
jgi:hypothetical protein